MNSNIHGYPVRLATVIAMCLAIGGLIIEKSDFLQINYQGVKILTATHTPKGWLVNLTGDAK